MTPEEKRDIALATANEIRSTCAAYKDEIRKGNLALEDAIRNCDLPISVFQLLTAAPRWGEVRADAAIRRAGLTGRNVLFGCGSQQARLVITPNERGRLIMALENPDPRRATFTSKLGLNTYQIRCIEKRMKSAGCSEQLIREVVAA